MNWSIYSNFQLLSRVRPIFGLVSFLVLGFGFQKANALNPGDVTIEIKSGPAFLLDKNNPCSGPQAVHVAYQICNTSGSTLSGLTADLTNLSSGFSLLNGQVVSQNIGTLSTGDCGMVFWYVGYPCSSGQTTNLTVTVADDNPGAVSSSDNVTTTTNQPTPSGSLLEPLPIPASSGPEDSTWVDVEYKYGNVPANGEIYFQPGGNLDYDAACLQLVGLEVQDSNFPSIQAGEDSGLYFVVQQAGGGGGNWLTVRYYFIEKCNNFTTTLAPYSAATSGNQVKYAANYSAIVATYPDDFQSAGYLCFNNPDDFATQINGTGIGLETSGDNWGASWGDYDGDGYPDLFVATYDNTQPNELYHNNGDGTFTKITSGPIATDIATSSASSWADYDNDGDLDLYVGNNIGKPNFLYRNEGGGNFTSIQNDPVVSYLGYSHGVSWADYDNDGFLDLFVATYWETAFNKLYHNNGDGTFSEVTNSPIVNEAAKTITGVWGDYDNDGLVDLFVVNMHDNHNSLYHNLGNGNFQKITSGAIVSDGGCSVGANWGDYNNDGYLDLFVANASNEANFLYQNNGNGTFSKITSGSIVTDVGHSHGSAWADYDNDGDLDLFVGDDTKNNAIYRNNGDGTFTSLDNEITNDGGLSFGSAWADFDQDGDLDLFVANRQSTENFLYENTKGNCNNWYDVKLTGTNSNASAVGARVTVTATINGQTVTQVQQVSSQTGGGTGGQNELSLHFGLGDAAVVTSVVVDWPSGYQQVLSSQAVNSEYTVTEVNGSEVCGTVYYDANGNCTQDNGESGIPGVKVELTPGNITAYSDADGNYSVFAGTGNYSIQATPGINWAASCSSTSSVNITGLGNQYCGISFSQTALCAQPDLYSEIATTAHRIGTVNLMVVNYENLGAANSIDTELSVSLPTQINLLSSSLPYDKFVGNEATWQLGDFEPNAKGAIYLTYEVLTSTPIGTSLTVTSNLNSSDSECDIANNVYVETSPAVAAFDPNDLLVSPEGRVRKEGWLHYKIRFQNVGNATASQVRVEDILPPELDLNTLELGTVSHTYKFQADGRHLVWTFPNINLPDSISNEQGSHGFITFRIKPKTDMVEGDRILNQAVIFFDNLNPVKTNVVENIISNGQQNHKGRRSLPLLIHPNPTSGDVKVLAQEMNLERDAYFVEMQVFDLSFRPVLEKTNIQMHVLQLSLDGWPSGAYIIRGMDNKGRLYTGKVIVAE